MSITTSYCLLEDLGTVTIDVLQYQNPSLQSRSSTMDPLSHALPQAGAILAAAQAPSPPAQLADEPGAAAADPPAAQPIPAEVRTTCVRRQ